MSSQSASATDERFLASGEEAGTAPDDRRFRPDVEGLRAVAVVLVVLYHAGLHSLRGGYIGVDVFFVISGFVITGLLLRERASTGRTSILDFYARRVRRILPAATLVLLGTVLATYVLLGFVDGNNAAGDGRWAAIFLANLHFEQAKTNYLQALRPASPLQNYWSLSVEEQFYVVFPTLVLVVAGIRSRISLRARLAAVLSAVIVASFVASVLQTSSQPAAAYFSPLTRAWELALGGLIAVCTPWLKQLEHRVAAALTWVGLAAVVYAAVHYNNGSAYPGSLVAIPVVGAGLIIAGGVAVPRWGAEVILAPRPVQWLGRRSYSLYLWHWPILVIAAEYANKSSLPFGENLPLILLSVVLSMVTYRFLENPVRHLKLPSRRSVAIGGVLVLSTVVILSAAISAEAQAPTVYRVVPAADSQAVSADVAAATRITTLPSNLEPSLSQAGNDWAAWKGNIFNPCANTVDINQYSETLCALGDVSSSKIMVVYGDSHTIMWLPAYEAIARAEHFRLYVLVKYFCPASLVTVANPVGSGNIGGPYVYCNAWHEWALAIIKALQPDLVIVSQDTLYESPATATASSALFPAAPWEQGITKLFNAMTIPDQDKVYLGNIPMLPDSGPDCLSRNGQDVQACSAPLSKSTVDLDPADRAGTLAAGARYIDPTPWFCSATCTAVVKNYDVYLDQFHVTGTYATYLANALAEALGYPPVSTGHKSVPE